MDSNATSARLKSQLDASEEAFSGKPELDGHIASNCFRALASDPSREAIVDMYPERKVMKSGMLLAAAIALSRRWKTEIHERRVGVVLPPGIGGTIANLALVLIDKTPVNLNFTIGEASVRACLQKGEVSTMVSAGALKKKVPNFPWPEDVLDIKEEIGSCGKLSIIGWLIAIKLLPINFLMRRLKIPTEGGRKEACLLFTSGSSGEPKGVVLTHRNIIANTLQIGHSCILPKGKSIMACLPIFHSFGCTVTLWYAICRGVRIVSFPTPLETRKIAEIIKNESVNVFVGAATFLRPFLKKASRDQMEKLDFVVAGSEKLPEKLYHSFLEDFGVPIHEGYGLTETSPVLSVNRPLDYDQEESTAVLKGVRVGSVGPLLTGITAKIVELDSGKELPLTDTGMLWVKGANVFGGYLGDEEKTREVMRDGWFITGDLARFDEDGFLYIEGRLSRFSKIGGEMVPHGLVEERIVEAMGWAGRDSQMLSIVSVPDEAKGEALVLLTIEEISSQELREKLVKAGLPNLWIPKLVYEVPAIPVLATGKCDLKQCESVAIDMIARLYAD
jgi:acyl-[acyl-carrier-protein]-phospholipid O-acyltransferase/long-chain-fatty-acid--[acyl-carrier-protein] ligase